MCKFFSLTSDGKGNIVYFNWEQRQKILNGEIEGNYCADSHTSINYYYGVKGAAEDKRNKYEYNPLTGEFTEYVIYTTDDSKIVEKAVRELDFKTIAEPLIIKPVVNPFKLPKVETVTERHISLLRKWASVYDSVGASVFASVGVIVGDSVWASVWNSVVDSVGYMVRNLVVDSVGYIVRDLVGTSVRDSVWVSVGALVWAYISSFSNIEKWQNTDHEPYVNPFQCGVDLWEMGLVPSYDGRIWRLHSGEKADVVWQGKF